MIDPDPGRDEFLAWLDAWYASLPDQSFSRDIVPRSEDGRPLPEQVAVLVVDLLKGFCTMGPLASPRVAGLAAPAADLLTALREWGAGHVLVTTDSHSPDAPEFQAFPPHCLAGTEEAEDVPELAGLASWTEAIRFPKNSTSVGQSPEFQAWVAAHPDVRAWIVLGDCTDLCVYQAATFLKTEANQVCRRVEVFVPALHVDTYDLPVGTARTSGAMPHPAEFLHRLFLYHLALNGLRVGRGVVA